MPARHEYGALDQDAGGRASDWASVRYRLEQESYFWVATTRSDGSPHTVPVCGLWMGDRLYIATHPSTVTARNLMRTAKARAHIGDAAEPVIIDAVARRAAADEVPQDVVDAYEQRFGERLDPADPEMPFFVLQPKTVLTWEGRDIRATAVRWTL